MKKYLLIFWIVWIPVSLLWVPNLFSLYYPGSIGIGSPHEEDIRYEVQRLQRYPRYRNVRIDPNAVNPGGIGEPPLNYYAKIDYEKRIDTLFNRYDGVPEKNAYVIVVYILAIILSILLFKKAKPWMYVVFGVLAVLFTCWIYFIYSFTLGIL